MIVAMTAPDNPVRPCYGCNVFDNHPRHEIINFDGTDAHGGPMHMDCCAALRNCDLCRAVLAEAYGFAGGGATGEDLREGLLRMAPMQVQHAQTTTSPFDVTEMWAQ
jgi:hypothetical protein